MALTAEALTLRLGGRTVLDGVDVTFAPGRVTALLGPNGAGKTTLLRALAGVVAPLAGRVQLDGDDVTAMEPRRRARRIGYLPQDGGAAWNLVVRDLVAIGRLAHRAPFAAESSADAAAIAAAMAATDVASFADRTIDTLSGGERARVLLARVLAGEPDWLLADEPLGALDPAHRLDLLDRLRGIAAAMAATDVASFADRTIDTLSGGERARVLLARVLAGEPDWLLADEPLGALDPAHRLDLLDRLRGIAAAGRGVVVVLHDLLDAGAVADDVVLLRDGRVVAAGPAAAVLTPENLRATYGLTFAVERDAAGRPRCFATGR